MPERKNMNSIDMRLNPLFHRAGFEKNGLFESVAHNRWVGAFWQSRDIIAVPTVSWSDKRSFEFCFDAIEQGSDVAIGMIGCKNNKKGFLYGYDAMLERISPGKILCVGNPFKEMRGNLILVPDEYPRRAVV